MKFYNLGTCSRPCGILKWRGLTIMLDCSLDISTVLNYLPLPLAGNSKFNSAPHFQNYKTTLEKELCDLNGYVMVDSVPLFGVPTEACVSISEIDVILISNSFSILALPFFTEQSDFNGLIYATEPTVNIGKFFMEELVEFVQSVPKPRVEQVDGNNENGSNANANGVSSTQTKKTTAPSVFKLLESSLNFPIKLGSQSFNKDLCEIYSKRAISNALLKVQIVGFSENTNIYGKVVATAVSSGFSLGSCNWVFKAEGKKVVYVTSSSTLTTHPSPLDQVPLKGADIFILTSLTQVPTQNPDLMMGEVCASVVSTLKGGGNVIFPCYPSGIIYDLFEFLTGHCEANSLGMVPFYFISPHAETSLAYSNILAEWLSSNKQRKVYIPEDPFTHAELVKNGRIRHFKTLHDIPEVRQPCVVFCGHPSLRFGDIVHLIESWGNNPANTIIFTEAQFPYIECLIPFQPLAMKAVHFPIDTSLQFHQAIKLIRDLKPGLLVTHEEYLVPPKTVPQRTELVIDYPNIEKLTPGCVVSLKLRSNTVNSLLDAKMARELMPLARSVNGVLSSTITAGLDNTNNHYRLVKPKLDNCDIGQCPPTKYTFGTPNVKAITHLLAQEGFTQPKVQHTTNGFIISIPTERVLITVDGSSTHVVCENDDGAIRVKLRRVLTSCLSQF